MTRLSLSDVATEPNPHARAFAQRLIVLDEALLTADDSVRQALQDLRAAVIRVRQELKEIQVSPLSTRTLVPAVCFDCGRKNLQVFYTSKHGGYRLCEACFNTRDQHGRARCSHPSADTVFGQIPYSISGEVT